MCTHTHTHHKHRCAETHACFQTLTGLEPLWLWSESMCFFVSLFIKVLKRFGSTIPISNNYSDIIHIFSKRLQAISFLPPLNRASRLSDMSEVLYYRLSWLKVIKLQRRRMGSYDTKRASDVSSGSTWVSHHPPGCFFGRKLYTRKQCKFKQSLYERIKLPACTSHIPSFSTH